MVLPPPPGVRKVRKQLSADALYALLREGFARIPDHRQPTSPIPLGDALLSAFALFALKDPSLLAFEDRRSDENMKALFGIGAIPSDTQMREILDPLDPEHLRPVFGDVFRRLQRGKALEPFAYYSGAYLLSLDGTGYFSSRKIHCPSCQVKEHKDGTVTYGHQMLAAVIVHPNIKEVIPLAPEPIQKQDGSTKNDCERNAARRLLAKIRREHPRLKLIVVEDGLASNGPHVRDLIESDMHFILGVKPGDHAFLFEQVEAACRQGHSPKQLMLKTRAAGMPSLPMSCFAAMWVHSQKTCSRLRCFRATAVGTREDATKTTAVQLLRSQRVSSCRFSTARRPIVTSSSNEIWRETIPECSTNLRGRVSPNQSLPNTQGGS
ncbi:MAG: hypothetical protein ABSG86_31180 [Thermoguttaceae bacterium]|jgi:hypothetical protein